MKNKSHSFRIVGSIRHIYDFKCFEYPERSCDSVVLVTLGRPKPFEIDNTLFKDVVLHCTQLCEEDMFAILSMLFINGGTYEKDLNEEKVTHLICNAASGPKYEHVLSSRPNIKLVTPDWFVLSVQQKQLLSEAEYHPRLLIVPKPPSSPKPQDLGDLSSITGFDDVDLPSGSEAPLDWKFWTPLFYTLLIKFIE
ncbi:PAX-interacting protein 1-like [Diaphorina citri]|uniref:PAX-interacting protein 1-like n=1 Tax=Diaphorina citri TaxID=121845 RepID=A0A3Q0JCU5_DIACI|nr:PAX-interacting protein 1-like [Diaphorina citri]